MEKKKLERANGILKEMEEIERVLYYFTIYNKNNDLNFFSFTHFDNDNNKREINLNSIHNLFLIKSIENQIEILNNEFEGL